MVQLYVRLPTTETRTLEMIRALSRVMVSAQIDRDCGHAELTRDAKEESILVYAEEWIDEAQLGRRIRSDGFQVLLGLMETCRPTPRLEVRFVSQVRGLDYVGAVRGVTASEPVA